MQIEYDTKVPKKHYKLSVYTEKFLEFYKSSCQNMKFTCESVAEAKRAQKTLCMVTSRKGIHDIILTRRENVLYVIRSGKENE